MTALRTKSSAGEESWIAPTRVKSESLILTTFDGNVFVPKYTKPLTVSITEAQGLYSAGFNPIMPTGEKSESRTFTIFAGKVAIPKYANPCAVSITAEHMGP